MDAVTAPSNVSPRGNESRGVHGVASDALENNSGSSFEQQQQKGASELPSNGNGSHQISSSAHYSRPFNQNHTRQFGQGHGGSGSRGRMNGGGGGGGGGGDGFRIHNHSNRRHQPRNFNGGNNYNRDHGNNARGINWHNRPHGFVNGAGNFIEQTQPQIPPFAPPNFASMENPIPYFNLPHLPVPRSPQFPGYVMPPMMYNGHPFFPEESTALYGPPVMAPVPFMDVMRGPPMPVPVPIRPPPPPVLNLANDPNAGLCNAILKQIEYYFCDENLKKDKYLTSQMDEQGWVSVHLIAGFYRIKNMTSDIDLILRALRPSRTVEVQGGKMRRRGDWMNYLTTSSSATKVTVSEEDILTAGVRNIQLDLRSEAEVAKAESEG